MDERTKKKILEFVKPLSAGLDGVTNFGNVERMAAAAEAIARGRADVDADRLFLLAVFSGLSRWVGKPGQGSRTELFLTSTGVAQEETRQLLRSLSRYEKSPKTPEEEIVHDARRLEEIGAYGIARIVVEGTRERMSLSEMAHEIDTRAHDNFRTEAGRSLAAARLSLMCEFAKRLRGEVEEFG